MKKLILCFLFFIWIVSDVFAGLPVAKVTIKAVDTKKRAVTGANVKVYFHFPNSIEFGLDTKIIRGLTNKNGEFTTKGKTIPNWVAMVSKEGYHDSGDGLIFEEADNYIFYKRWRPWNPTIEVVLREKRNPVKMYLKDIEHVEFPALGQEVGYDLVKGDWVAPYGKGVVKDFIFIFSYSEKENVIDVKSKYELKFSNEGDGFQKYRFKKIDSVFRWPYLAPIEGYEIKTLKKYNYYLSDGDPTTKALRINIKENMNYIFRVRTELDADGNVIGGMYGVMRDDIFVKDGLISFKYKLNPKGRSLEYDGNLFDKD